MVDYKTDCKFVEVQRSGPWCNKMQWRLLKGVTKNPCEKCINYVKK